MVVAPLMKSTMRPQQALVLVAEAADEKLLPFSILTSKRANFHPAPLQTLLPIRLPRLLTQRLPLKKIPRDPNLFTLLFLRYNSTQVI